MFFSVKSGKTHVAAEAVTRDNAWKPTKTACGLIVTPLNYFEDRAAALSYTGGRDNICHHCSNLGGNNAPSTQ